MALIVQKYGGTSVADTQRIRNVANRVCRTYDRGENVVVILSAMAGVTDHLIGLANAVTDDPDRRELDVLLATGEQTTAALLAMMLKGMGYKAQSLLGHQAEVVTDCEYGNARILEIGTDRINRLLSNRNIIVVAGFQGADIKGNITTLGRGGSDTSAVAIAATLSADVCEIYTDVDGIYTADPNICPKARKIKEISYDEMLNMASLGAKVLQIRSVGVAKKYNIPVHVRSSFSEEEGTMVVQEDSVIEQLVVSGVTHDLNQARITLKKVPDQPGVAAKNILSNLRSRYHRGHDHSKYTLRRRDGLDLYRSQGRLQKGDGNRKAGGGEDWSRGSVRRPADREGFRHRRRNEKS